MCLKKTIVLFQNYILLPGVSGDPKDHKCDTKIKISFQLLLFVFVDL